MIFVVHEILPLNDTQYVTHLFTEANVLLDSCKGSSLTRDMSMKLNALLLDKLMFTSTIHRKGTHEAHDYGVLKRSTQTC